MAKVIVNPKGFKVIETTADECFNLGGIAICDHCHKLSSNGYLIAVLNHWTCPECFNDWYKDAIAYEEDEECGQGNFNYYCSILNIEKDV